MDEEMGRRDGRGVSTKREEGHTHIDKHEYTQMHTHARTHTHTHGLRTNFLQSFDQLSKITSFHFRGLGYRKKSFQHIFTFFPLRVSLGRVGKEGGDGEEEHGGEGLGRREGMGKRNTEKGEIRGLPIC